MRVEPGPPGSLVIEVEGRRYVVPPGEIGPALSDVHSLPDHVVRIGRTATNDILPNDLLVSRQHAEVRRTAAGTQIVDLDSGNGTFVNGQRIHTARGSCRDRWSRSAGTRCASTVSG